jgi:hypothetical protein
VIYVTDRHILVIAEQVLIDGFTTLLLTNVSLSFMVVVIRMEITSELKQNVPDNVKVSLFNPLYIAKQKKPFCFVLEFYLDTLVLF